MILLRILRALSIWKYGNQELQVNNCANFKNAQELEYKRKTVSNVSKSINVTKKDMGVKCVVDVKSKATQLGRENPVS